MNILVCDDDCQRRQGKSMDLLQDPSLPGNRGTVGTAGQRRAKGNDPASRPASDPV